MDLNLIKKTKYPYIGIKNWSNSLSPMGLKDKMPLPDTFALLFECSHEPRPGCRRFCVGLDSCSRRRPFNKDHYIAMWRRPAQQGSLHSYVKKYVETENQNENTDFILFIKQCLQYSLASMSSKSPIPLPHQITRNTLKNTSWVLPLSALMTQLQPQHTSN